MTDLFVAVDGDGPAAPEPQDPAWRRMIVPIMGLALAFAVGLGTGYQVRGAVKPTPHIGPVAAADVVATGQQCATQIVTTLWLGVEVINHGPGGVMLRAIVFSLPLAGLREQVGMWAACGQLNAGPVSQPQYLAEGETTWVSGTFEVQTDCPLPVPVQFSLTYTDSTGVEQVRAIGGFPDLGHVPYSGCHTQS
jgi:hypothetical protein